ncbi:hypothetical protein KBD81_04820 [Candidatus Woesebacteria bacterium]|nr:hypothetical protein [Candidatus Woesebacteria bacterium]
MNIPAIKTTIEIDSNLFYMAKRKALKEGKTLKDIVNESLSDSFGAAKTVDLLSKIQEITEQSAISETELQQSGRSIREELNKKYYKDA